MEAELNPTNLPTSLVHQEPLAYFRDMMILVGISMCMLYCIQCKPKKCENDSQQIAVCFYLTRGKKIQPTTLYKNNTGVLLLGRLYYCMLQ